MVVVARGEALAGLVEDADVEILKIMLAGVAQL